MVPDNATDLRVLPVNIKIVQQNLLERSFRSYWSMLFAQGLLHTEFSTDTFFIDDSFLYIGHCDNVIRLSKPAKQNLIQVLLAYRHEDFAKMSRWLLPSELRASASRGQLTQYLKTRLSDQLTRPLNQQKLSHILSVIVEADTSNSMEFIGEIEQLLVTVKAMENWAESRQIQLSLVAVFTEYAEQEISGDFLSLQALNDWPIAAMEWKDLLGRLPEQLESRLAPRLNEDPIHHIVSEMKTLNRQLRTLSWLLALLVFIAMVFLFRTLVAT